MAPSSVHVSISRPRSQQRPLFSWPEPEVTSEGLLAPYDSQESLRTVSGYDDVSDDTGISPNEKPRPDKRNLHARIDKRSIHFANLSDRTTHKDIVDVIRGGTILDIYLRNDRTANVSFVDGGNAAAFLNYVKRNDVYIHGKRARSPVEFMEMTALTRL